MEAQGPGSHGNSQSSQTHHSWTRDPALLWYDVWNIPEHLDGLESIWYHNLVYKSNFSPFILFSLQVLIAAGWRPRNAVVFCKSSTTSCVSVRPVANTSRTWRSPDSSSQALRAEILDSCASSAKDLSKYEIIFDFFQD